MHPVAIDVPKGAVAGDKPGLCFVAPWLVEGNGKRQDGAVDPEDHARKPPETGTGTQAEESFLDASSDAQSRLLTGNGLAGELRSKISC